MAGQEVTTLSSELDKLIEKLPKEIREMVRVHLKTVITLEFEEQQGFINRLLTGHYFGAYEMLNKRLRPAERINEQERLNELIEHYNRSNAAKMQMWRDFFRALLAIALQQLQDKII